MAKSIKKAANVPADETKAAKFSRLASKRVTVALAKIKLIGNLAGSGYEYTPEQVAKIGAALTETAKQTMTRFDKSARKEATSDFTV